LWAHRWIGSEEVHAECCSARRDGSADPPKTDDAKTPTTQFKPLELGARPCPFAHRPIPLCHVPRECKE
jgi:hypothetical protein